MATTRIISMHVNQGKRIAAPPDLATSIAQQLQKRVKAVRLLQKRQEQRPKLHTGICLTENLLKLKEYREAYKELQFMRKHWYRREEYWILYVKYCAEQRLGRELAQALAEMKREHIYLSSKGKEALALWLDA